VGRGRGRIAAPALSLLARAPPGPRARFEEAVASGSLCLAGRRLRHFPGGATRRWDLSDTTQAGEAFGSTPPGRASSEAPSHTPSFLLRPRSQRLSSARRLRPPPLFSAGFGHTPFWAPPLRRSGLGLFGSFPSPLPPGLRCPSSAPPGMMGAVVEPREEGSACLEAGGDAGGGRVRAAAAAQWGLWQPPRPQPGAREGGAAAPGQACW
uniref:Uncharacterized protein n=1 Tax=Naja naja TaxID=35670 RepID=A0A8C6XG68_NAJNA